MKKIFLLLTITILSITKSFACQCVQVKGDLAMQTKRSFVQSNLVMTGKVIEIQKNESSSRSNEGMIELPINTFVYTFEIIKTYKGKIEKELVKVKSSGSGSTCGYKFKLGDSYLVYARKSMSKNAKVIFETGLCDRNQILTEVNKEELEKLTKLIGYTEPKESKRL